MLDVGGIRLMLVLHIACDGAKGVRATLDSPDQGVVGVPVNLFMPEENALHLEIEEFHASYTGTLSVETGEIRGTFSQGRPLPLTFKRGVSLRRRPQEPQPPFPYALEVVSFENREAGITLAGTLTHPSSPGPFPAAVLITGSGPHDRDETVFGHKPFLVLADYLTRLGIAVLRFDDRGVAESTGDFGSATSLDFATDVAAAVEYLQGRQEINAEKIGLIGHSEGGLIAPIVATQVRGVAFCVLMAGPGVSGEELLLKQQELLLRTDRVPEEQIAQNRSVQERLFAILKSEGDRVKAEEQLRDFLGDAEALDGQSAIDAQIRTLNSPWYRYFLTHEPGKVLRAVTVPVLALNGGLDLQVAPSQNLPAISEALRQAGNEDYTVVELPGLNHLFQTCTTGAVAEYAEIEETLSPKALELISDWIVKRVSPETQIATLTSSRG